MEMKINIGDPKAKRTLTHTLPADDAKSLFGRKIGDKIKGEILGKAGYEFEITGGSDNAGFPMRKDIAGQKHVKAVLSGRPGLRGAPKGYRKAKLVTGNAVSPLTHQLNLKIEAYGPKTLDELGLVKPKAEKKE